MRAAGYNRSPSRAWLIAMITGGAMMPWSAMELARDLNAVVRSDAVDVDRYSNFLLILLAAYGGILLVLLYRFETGGKFDLTPFFVMAFVAGAGGVTATMGLLASVHTRINDKFGESSDIESVAFIVGLTFLFMMSVPYLQDRLNRLAASC